MQDTQQQFWAIVQQAWQQGQFVRLILSQYHGDRAQLEKINIRPIELKQQQQLNIVYRHTTQDITKNMRWEDFAQQLVQ